MYEEFLKKTGLTKDQATIYETLVRQGPLPAGKLSKLAGLKRGLTYKVLGELENLGLLEKKDEPQKVLRFEATHPLRMRDLVEKNERDAKDAREVLETILPKLVSDYNLVSGKPGVRFYEGEQGLQNIYDDIIRTGSDIRLMRSIYDDQHPNIDRMVMKQIAREVQAGIRTRAITPLVDETPATVLAHDAERLVERRIVPREKLLLPAQIIIYKNKVAITDLKDTLVSMLVENENVAETFVNLFEYVWELAEPIHKTIAERITRNVSPAEPAP